RQARGSQRCGQDGGRSQAIQGSRLEIPARHETKNEIRGGLRIDERCQPGKRVSRMSTAPASIAVGGGGIGGLTAAAVLLRARFDVQVYEQAKTLGEIGAGINISPNASRILHRLGIADALERTGVKPRTFDQRRWDDGRFLLRAPLGEPVESTFGAPYYT